jgi:hypothetical protein
MLIPTASRIWPGRRQATGWLRQRMTALWAYRTPRSSHGKMPYSWHALRPGFIDRIYKINLMAYLKKYLNKLRFMKLFSQL